MDEGRREIRGGPARGDDAIGPGTAGLVLAAGRSTRMGRSKPLLEVGGRTFLRATVEALRGGGCAPVLAVVAEERVAEEGRAAGAKVVEGRPEGEQVDSLRSGLSALPSGVAGVLVLPVDHPLVAPATVRALLEAGRDHPDAVVRPVYEGRPGHPTLFPARSWAGLMDPALPQGARSVVEGEGAVVDVEVEDAGVVTDIDTPESYHRLAGGGA